MKKRIVFIIIALVLSISLTCPTYALGLKVKTKSKQTIYCGQIKDKKFKVFFDGKNVTKDCEIKIKGNRNKAISWDYSNCYTICADDMKKNKYKIKFVVKFDPSEDGAPEPYYYYDKNGEIQESPDYVVSERFGIIK